MLTVVMLSMLTIEVVLNTRHSGHSSAGPPLLHERPILCWGLCIDKMYAQVKEVILIIDLDI